MIDTSDLINKINNGEMVVINNNTFDKKTLKKLSKDLLDSYHKYKDSDSQKLIRDYHEYLNNNKISTRDFIRTLIVSFSIGFSCGIFIASIISVFNTTSSSILK